MKWKKYFELEEDRIMKSFNGGKIGNKPKVHKNEYKHPAIKRVKNVRFLEALKLRKAGRIDGTYGLPKQVDADYWNSTFIDGEANGYEEFCSRMWERLQQRNEGAYVRLEELSNQILQTYSGLEAAKAELSAACYSGKQEGFVRKTGEDKLTDAQVRARRTTEDAKRLEPLKSKVDVLENTLTCAVTEVSMIRSRLQEGENTTRMICYRMKEHILRRIDVYWNAALKTHPDSAEMPVVPEVELTSRGEQAYMRLHESLISRVEALCIQVADNKVKKEAV